MSKLLVEASWYGVASLAALGVDAGILWTLVHNFSINYLLAASASFTLGAGVAYAISIRLAFHHHRLRDKRAEFASFVALGLPGLLINFMVISAAVGYFELDILPAKGLAALTTFLLNFIVRRQLLFASK